MVFICNLKFRPVRINKRFLEFINEYFSDSKSQNVFTRKYFVVSVAKIKFRSSGRYFVYFSQEKKKCCF